MLSITNNNNESIIFSIKYDGEALTGGSMDVRDLAPSLLALGELIDHIDTINNGYTSNLKTHIKGDFKTGSFQTFLEVVYTNRDKFSSLLNGDTINAIINAKEVLETIFGIGTVGSGGLIYLIKSIGDRKISTYEETDFCVLINHVCKK